MATTDSLRNLCESPVYPGIKKLGWVSTAVIPVGAIVCMRLGLDPGYVPEPRWIELDGTAVLQQESERGRLTGSQTSKLTFKVREIDFPAVCAWVAVDANDGIWLLIGPPPHVGSFSCSSTSSEVAGDPVLLECTVTVPDIPHKIDQVL